MGVFVTSKDTLYIKFDLNTQTIVQNDNLTINYYENYGEYSILSTDNTNSNFDLLLNLGSEFYSVSKKSGTISNDIGIFNEFVTLKATSFENEISYDISIQVEYFSSENPDTPLPEPEPTYNLKYWLEFTNQNAISHRLEILQLGFEGASTQIYGNYVHQYTKKKDIHETVVPSNLSIDLEANTTLTLNDLYSEEEQTFLVKAYRNSQLIFIGFIKPDGIYEDWVSDRWMLSIDCYDGLNILKDLSFVKNDGMFFKNNMSELNAIYYSLIRTKLDLPINVCIDVFNSEYSFDIYHSVLEQVYINTERYHQDVEKEKIMDCNEVVSSILSTYNASIIQMNGEWFIYRPIDVKNGMTFKRYVNGIFDNEIYFEVGKTLGSHINGLENFDAIHCNANQRKTISPSCQAFRVNYKYGTVASLTINPDLKLGDRLNIDGWVVNNPDGKVYRNTNGYGINSSIILSDSTYFNNRTLLLKNNSGASASEGDLLDLEIKFSNIGYAGRNTSYIGLHYEIYTDNYQFCLKRGTNQAYWKLKTLLNDTEDYYKFIQYNGKYGYGKGEAILNLSLPSFPENTNIFISIFRDVTYSSDYSNEYRLIINSIKIIPKSNQSYKGEYHDSQFKKRKSTKSNKDLVVYNGDTLSEIYYGTLLNAENNALEAKWYRFGFTEERELLSICAEDRLRSAPRPMIEFEGDIMGYIPFLSFVSINNIAGNFQPIEYTYNANSDTIKLVNREFSNTPLDNTTFSVEKSYDYGNVTKVTIRS